MIQKNGGDADELRTAYNQGDLMLAGIVKLVSRSSRTAAMRFAFMGYKHTYLPQVAPGISG